ncbi:MAG: Fe/S biogenesis protein NfuA [Deltaproteobacteria bacterium ADurb.Bin072]|nr:MAG: Fe/S biogenesis protein NfuA [Deltaproteobacteria bacterium ADurb.Bin072]
MELVDVSPDGIIQVRLKGACHGCPMATMTLKSLIERVLKKEVPGVKEVKAVA